MEIILVRHTSVDVPKGTCYGQTDVEVAPTFEQEAALTKQALAEYVPFDRVYTSPLKRAVKLAAYCGYPDATPDARLMEMAMGDWEMQRYDDITDPSLQEWYEDYMHLPTPGGESFPVLRARVAAFLDELSAKPYRRVAVFAHGGVLISAGLYAGLFAEQHAWDHLVPFGGLQRIEI
ncbi:MAG: alpha-ribazole phosphatase [Prevotella sp.]|nr:alpha-ribazole phosphatase [Prevotella sp.]